jgi:hypothetical protein
MALHDEPSINFSNWKSFWRCLAWCPLILVLSLATASYFGTETFRVWTSHSSHMDRSLLLESSAGRLVLFPVNGSVDFIHRYWRHRFKWKVGARSPCRTYFEWGGFSVFEQQFRGPFVVVPYWSLILLSSGLPAVRRLYVGGAASGGRGFHVEPAKARKK